MSVHLGSSADTSILVDDDSASEHEDEGEVFHTALEDAVIPKEEELEIEVEVDETDLIIDNPFIGDGLNRDISMIAQPEDDQHVEPETDGWEEDDFKRDVICGTPAMNTEEGERRFVYWNPPSVTEEQESPFLFFPSASERPATPPATPPTASALPATDDVIILSGPESEVEAMVGEVKPNIPIEAEKAAPKKRKRAAPRASKIPPAPQFRYPAGKMAAAEFIAASSTFHLVIEQEGTPVRIGRAFLKPREFSTGSYGWSGAFQGGLPTTKGQVQVRCMVNLIAKGSKPIQINKPPVPVKRT